MELTKIRRLLSLLLILLLPVCALPVVALPIGASNKEKKGRDTIAAAPSLAATATEKKNGADAIASAFDKDYLVTKKELSADQEAGIPVTVKTYADKTKYEELGAKAPMPTTSDGPKYEVLMYIIGINAERIGQEDDVSIIGSYLDEGYIVVVFDFKEHTLAAAGYLESAIYNLKKRICDNKEFLDKLGAKRPYCKTYCTFVLLEGYRIARNIAYYNLLDNGLPGTAEKILEAWNDTTNKNGFKGTKESKIPACEWNGYQKGKWYEAADVSQLVRPDPVTKEAVPLDFNLGLHILYPSKPTRETAVFMNASSHEHRESQSASNAGRDEAGLALRGYTIVSYDHEYYPMARDDHYGYFLGSVGYGLAKWLGVKTHTAAVRCVRYYAAEFGYSDYEGYSASGGSKSSYCSILGSDEPNDRPEIASYAGGPFDDRYGKAGQPYLTYGENSPKAGQTISARIQGVITMMGDGTNRHAEIVNRDTSPTVIACGIMDQFGSWDVWPACQQTYMDCDVVNLAISMYDKGHAHPIGIDTVLKYERTQAMIDFIEYNANVVDVPAKVIYTYPYDGAAEYKGEEPILIHFTGPIPKSEVEKHIKIVDADTGKVLEGRWIDMAGDAKYSFETTESFIGGHTYRIEIGEELKDTKGQKIKNPGARTFLSNADIPLEASFCGYLRDGSVKELGQDATLLLSKDSTAGYLEFDKKAIPSGITAYRLALTVKNNAVNRLAAYSVKTENGKLLLDKQLASVEITGDGLCLLELTEFVTSSTEDTLRIAITAEQAASGGNGYEQSFENELSKSTDKENVCHSTEYDYRAGGAPKSLGVSTDKNHTEGGKYAFRVERQHEYDRFKLYNVIKTSPLDSYDIGTTYKITAYAYTDEPMSLTMGLMSAAGDSYGTKFYGETSVTSLKAGEWTKCTLTYTITEGNIEEQIGMLTMQGSSLCTFYIDDVSATKSTTDIELYAKGDPRTPALRLDQTKVVATVGGNAYDSLEKAIDAVLLDAKPVTVVLREDVKLTTRLTIAAKQSIILDLGGNTLDASAEGSTALLVQGKLTLKNGRIVDDTRGAANARTTIHVKGNGAELLLEDNLFIKSNADYSAVRVGSSASATKQQSKVTLRDGVEIDAFWYAVDAYPDGAVTIEGGSYTNTENGLIVRFQKNADGFASPREISGGRFTVKKGDRYDLLQKCYGLTVTGGEFSEFLQPGHIGNGYLCDDNDGDGYFTVFRDPAILKVSGTTLTVGETISLNYMVKKSLFEGTGLSAPYLDLSVNC